MTFKSRQLVTSTILGAAALIFQWGPHAANAQTNVESTFTYQGQLQLAGAPYDGEVEMVFRLFGVDEGGGELAPSVTVEDLEVSSGIFSADLDFGYDTFDGTARWIEIEVEGTVLEPRQPIMATPYALFALDGNEGPQGPQGPEGASPFELVNGNAIFPDGQVAIGAPEPAGGSQLTINSLEDGSPLALLNESDSPTIVGVGRMAPGFGAVDSLDMSVRTTEGAPTQGMSNRILLRLMATNGVNAAAGSMEATWVNPDANEARSDLIFRNLGEDGYRQRLRLSHEGFLGVGGSMSNFPNSGIDVRTSEEGARAANFRTSHNQVMRTNGFSSSGSGIVTSASFWAGAPNNDPDEGHTNRVEWRLQSSNGAYGPAVAIDAVTIDPSVGNRTSDMVIRTGGEDGFNERMRVTHDGNLVTRHIETASGVGGISTVIRGDRNLEFSKGGDSVLSGWYRFWNDHPSLREEQFRISANGDAQLRGTLNQNAFDIAESFLRTDEAQPGQLIAVDPNNPHAVRLATSSDGGAVIGVVSTEPGIVLGGPGMDLERLRTIWGEDVYQQYMSERDEILSDLIDARPALATELSQLEKTFGHALYERTSTDGYTSVHDGDSHGTRTQLESKVMEEFAERHLVEVALAGRVPVQVDAGFGAIEVGDYLAPSPTPGVAKRASSPGPVIGTALESHGEGDGEIVVFVHRGHYTPASGGDDATKAELRAEITALEERLERLEALLTE